MDVQTISYYDILARISDGDGTFEYDDGGSITYTDGIYIDMVEVRDINFDAGVYGAGKESADTVRSMLKEFGIEHTGEFLGSFDENRELCKLFVDLLCSKLSKTELVFTNCSIETFIPFKSESVDTLTGVTFDNCKFSRNSNIKCNLSNCNFYSCEFTGSTFGDKVFIDCVFANPTFRKASACWSVFRKCEFRNIEKEKFDINLRNAVFHACEGLAVYSLLNFGTYFGSVTYIPVLDLVKAGCWEGSLVEFIERCTTVLEDVYAVRFTETASHNERKLRIQFKTGVDYFIEIYKLYEGVTNLPASMANRIALFEESLAQLEV